MANPIFNLNSTRTQLVKAIATLINQLPAVAPNVVVMIDGVAHDLPQVLTELESDIAIVTAAEDARLQMIESARAERAMRVALQTLGSGLRGYVANQFGSRSSQASTLGFQRKQPAPLSTAAQLTRVEKLRATRKARGTMGKRQRAGIHGAAPALPKP